MAPARGARRRLGARRPLPLAREREGVLTLLAPGVELVRLEPRFPAALGLLVIAREPVGAPQLLIGLDQIGAEPERLLKQALRAFVPLARQVDDPPLNL